MGFKINYSIKPEDRDFKVGDYVTGSQWDFKDGKYALQIHAIHNKGELLEVAVLPDLVEAKLVKKVPKNQLDKYIVFKASVRY